MESLSILDLSWNSLAGGLPAALGSLRMLEKADLSHNELAGRVPAEVGSLRELVFLDLSHNELAGPLPASMAGLGKLQYLLLQENPIGTAVPAAVVGSLRRLQVVGMSGCGLTGPIRAARSPRWPAWRRCRSTGTGSTGRSRRASPLPRLGRLNLSQNRLAGDRAAGGVRGAAGQAPRRAGQRRAVRRPGRYGGAQASYLGAPPCAAAGGGSGQP